MNKHVMKKKFGQNFLTDKNLLSKIVDSAKIEDKNVIEIGPGKGALTNFLVKKAKQVTAYEVDLDLKTYLSEIEEANANFNVIYGDFLETNIDPTNQYHVVANIPYNITSPIIFKILEQRNIESATLMVQKEVCDRITSKPNSKAYNALSVIVQYYMNVEKIINVNKKMFYPIPKVDSAVFKMSRKKLIFDFETERIFLKIVKCSFTQKRKTILNNLSSSVSNPKEEVKNFLNDLEIDENKRAENITLEQFISMTKNWRLSFNDVKEK